MDDAKLPLKEDFPKSQVAIAIKEEDLANLFNVQKDIQERARNNPLFKGTKYMGKNIGFFWIRNEPLFTLGPHWPLFLCTWSFFTVMGVLISAYVAQSSFWKCVSFSITFFQSFVYLYTATINQGVKSAINPNDSTLNSFAQYPSFCKDCRLLRTRATVHCYDCGVCIEGYDHHCPWTGKCIGKGNVVAFNIFLCSTCFYIMYCMFMVFQLVWYIQAKE